MNTTSLSLLERVRDPLDNEAWGRLVDLYTPFLFAWGQRMGLKHADAADLVQEVLIVLAKTLPTFQYDPSKSFRSWLKTITLNRAKNVFRAAGIRPMVGVDSAIGREAAVGSEADLFEEQEHSSYILKQLLGMVKGEFREDVWQAFQLQMIEGLSATEVAETLGMSVNSVYIAKSRVLRRLRDESHELLD